MNEQRRVLDPLAEDIKAIKKSTSDTHDAVTTIKSELANNIELTKKHDKTLYGNGFPGVKSMVYALYLIFVVFGAVMVGCMWGK